ncbi:MAG TPA: ATP synthase F1 subunit delta [Acidobacteriaceae bacterium]|jgi:F-type H+-transporting ATPase subunit delta|nr:ATP synthase F1 subunit delta [Acidobacteriaceae bacterium]
MSVFASRYARALADVVMSEKLNTDQTNQQLQDFGDTFAGSKDLRELFENPSVPLEAKLKIVDAIASRLQFSPQLRNFIAVLLQHDRIAAYAEIFAEYRHEIDTRLNIGEVEIVSTRELDHEERAALETRAAGLAGKKVRAVYRQDPSLLGGVVLRIGTIIYDGSVQGRLDRLREQLVES